MQNEVVKIIKSDFGKILSELMKEKNMTQADVAASTGYTQRAISKWINGQSEPSAIAIIRCAKFFDVSADYILGLEE